MKRSSSSSSSKTHKKCSTAPAPAPEKMERRKKQSPRNPLRDLNGITGCTNNASSGAGTSQTSSSSASIEAPRGCLRFLLSHSSSSTKTPFNRPVKSLSKTPKSAPIARPTKPPSKPKTPKDYSSKCTVSEKPTSEKPHKIKKNPPCLYQWKSGKNPSFKDGHKLKNPSVLDSIGNSALESGSEKLKQQKHSLARIAGDLGEQAELRLYACANSDGNLTPMSKVATGSGLDCTIDKVMDDEKSNPSSNTKTPPILASVSPEIQCGSAMVSTTTPACYGAGHVLSGITDKRKCRPRGILTVEDNDLLGLSKAKAFDTFDTDNDEENVIEVINDSSVSLVPSPTEASMHWLLSPCNEEDEDEKENFENGSCRFQRLVMGTTLHSPSSMLSGHGLSSDVCNNNSNRCAGTTSTRRSRSASLLSTGELPEFCGFLEPVYDRGATSSSPHATPTCKVGVLKESKEKRKYHYDSDGENSPSCMDSLGSGNVIQTPQSASSLDRHVGLSWLCADDHKNHLFDSLLDSVAENLHMASLSPKNHASVYDPTNFSFQFDCLTTPSNSVDFSKFQKMLDDRVSWISSSTLENVSQSQMRISWRDGLVSRIFEMDEFDCCRCLSDEEEDVNGCSNDQSKTQLNVYAGNDHILTDGFGSTEFVDSKQEIDEKGEENLPPQIPSSCAESISTDGGGLVRSEDSDWTLCYKNQLFEV